MTHISRCYHDAKESFFCEGFATTRISRCYHDAKESFFCEGFSTTHISFLLYQLMRHVDQFMTILPRRNWIIFFVKVLLRHAFRSISDDPNPNRNWIIFFCWYDAIYSFLRGSCHDAHFHSVLSLGWYHDAFRSIRDDLAMTRAVYSFLERKKKELEKKKKLIKFFLMKKK